MLVKDWTPADSQRWEGVEFLNIDGCSLTGCVAQRQVTSTGVCERLWMQSLSSALLKNDDFNWLWQRDMTTFFLACQQYCVFKKNLWKVSKFWKAWHITLSLTCESQKYALAWSMYVHVLNNGLKLSWEHTTQFFAQFYTWLSVGQILHQNL